MSDAPAPPSGRNLPARKLSGAELEAVIRRAVELQSAAGGGDEGISEAEVIRIGGELGLEATLVRRALGEVRSQPPAEAGALARVMGPATARAGRIVRLPPAEVGMRLEDYLVRCEYMVVQRRLPDRTRYARATGMAAAVGRATRGLGSGQPALDVAALDVGVSTVDAESAWVELSLEMATPRGWLAGAGVGSGGALATLAGAFAWATPAPDLLALLGIPILAGTLFAARGAYRALASSRQDRLESLLDRLEHGELKLPPQKGEWRKQLGI
ncbi:MAG: hypothetical protein M3483_04205 [Gemmatimonadota bacterium]|nr:hypothetical protein [Gemmatimonadota bacterium]